MTQSEQSYSQLHEPEHTPQVADQYLDAEILLPRGDQMAIGHVVPLSHGVNGMFWIQPMQILF